MTNNGTGGLGDAKQLIGRIGPLIGIAVVLGVLAVAALSKVGCANHHTPPGFEGYIRSQPLFGAGEFVGIQQGPTSTGWVWRLHVVNIDMRPRTYSEEMSIRTAKGSDLTFKAHVRIRLEPKGSKAIVEKLGGPNWYDLNVKKTFQRAVREEVQALEPFEVKEKTDDIAKAVLDKLRKEYEDGPIQFSSVDIGNIEYPQVIMDSVEQKFVTGQINQRKIIEMQIAEKQIEIAAAEARGTADAQRVIGKTLDPLLLQYEALRAIEQLAGSEHTTFLLMPLGESGSAPVIVDLAQRGARGASPDGSEAGTQEGKGKKATTRKSAKAGKQAGQAGSAN